MRPGEFPQDVAQRIGYRTPDQTGLGSALNSGLGVATVDCFTIATAPGPTVKGGAKCTRPDGATARRPHVLHIAAYLRKLFRCQFARRPEDAEPVEDILSGAMRYAQRYVSE